MNNKLRFVSIFLFCLLNPVPLTAAETPAVDIKLQGPRNFGYSLGDEITLTALIDTPLFYRLEDGFLPQPGPVNNWLELKSIHVDESPDGYDYKLTLTFQLFKAVLETTQLSIPPLPLRFHHGSETVEQPLPAWTFTYHPLLPSHQAMEQQPIQPLLPAPHLPDRHSQNIQGLLLALSGLALYLLWFYGKLPFLERYNGPFGRACQTLKKILRLPATEQNYRLALRQFHQAINETAGKTVFYEQLPMFFQRFPAYQPLQQQTEQLFQISQRVFFTGAAAPGETASLREIAALCQLYRKIERGGRWL